MTQILIVDDSISVRKALELTFKRHDLPSVSAVSGEQALDVLHDPATGPVSLVMADVVMPGMSGLELCVSVRGDERLRGLPVILMSGTIDEALRAEALEVGADGVLRKPFSPDELLPMVQGLLERAAQAAQPLPEPVAEPADDLEDLDTAADFEFQDDAEPSRPMHDETELAEAQATEPEADPLAAIISQLQGAPGHEGLLVLDAQGQVRRQSGAVPEKLLVFLPFYANTARVLGEQVMHEALSGLSLTFAEREVSLHPHGEELLVEVRHRNRTLN